MLLSQLFVVSQLKSIGIDLPEDPDGVEDDLVNRLLIFSGAHQRLISLARCQKITNDGISNLPLCRSLLYLNLSYTNIRDISAISNCEILRGVNAAGTNFESYEPLKWLNNLEVLNLSFSSIEKAGSSFNDLRMLRSLDLGNTSITSLEELSFLTTGRLTRLEELLLDGTLAEGFVSRDDFAPPPVRQHNQKEVEAPQEMSEPERKIAMDKSVRSFVEKVLFIPSLLVVNLGNTPVLSHIEKMQLQLPSTRAHVVLRPRSYFWFLNIIVNDHEEVRSMILNGMDVNCKASEEEMELFCSAWKTLCQEKTQFFDCINNDDSLRPAGIHVAILFNSVECLKHIVRAEAVQKTHVWLGNVEIHCLGQTSPEDTVAEFEEDDGNSKTVDGEDLTADEASQGLEESYESQEASSFRNDTGDSGSFIVNSDTNNDNWKDNEVAHLLYRRQTRERSYHLKPVPMDASIEKDTTTTKRNVTCDNALSFAKRVYDVNIHRITERMTEKRVTGWKLLSRTLLTRLENILLKDPEEFNDDYCSVASVGSVPQVSVATGLSKAQIVETMKAEAAKKKAYSVEEFRQLFGTGTDDEQQQDDDKNENPKDPSAVLLAGEDADEWRQRASGGTATGSRGGQVSEEMIRLQLRTAQSDRASTAATDVPTTDDPTVRTDVTAAFPTNNADNATTTVVAPVTTGSLNPKDSATEKERKGGLFPELFAAGSERCAQDEVSVISQGSARGECFVDEFFPHIPSLEQCSQWEPLHEKLTRPVKTKIYTSPENTLSPRSSIPSDNDLLENTLGMKYFEVPILGKKSFWLESKAQLLKERVKADELIQMEEDRYKLERWRNFISDSNKEVDGKMFARDGRVAKPMKLLYKNGLPLTRAERKEKLSQLLKENRDKYIL